jgi:hypothetical protein
MPTLLLIIPSVWFTAAALVVLLCRSAARGDEALYERMGGDRERYERIPGEEPSTPCERRERRLSAVPLRDRDGRSRGGRCATGS